MSQTTTQMTVEDYIKLPHTTQPTELINGEIIVSPAPLHRHQRIVMRLIQALLPLVPEGGELVTSPDDVYLDRLNAIQPDVFLIMGEDSLCKLGENGYLYGAPDLVCEILSPSTAARDKLVKFSLYEKHGVREYWLIDPANEWIEIFTRQDDKLVLSGVYYQTVFVSPLLQHEIDTHKLFLGVNA